MKISGLSNIVSFISILYREIWQKTNVTWLDGGDKVEFGQKKTYHFRPELSTKAPGTDGEDTKLILPNLPMMVCSHYVLTNEKLHRTYMYLFKL